MENTRPKEIGSHWETRRASNYNEIGWVREPAFLEKLVHACGTGDSALSLGCGTGVILRRLAGQYRRRVGVDVSQAMLDQGDFRGIETYCQTLETIPWSGEFDLVEMRNVLHCVHEPAAALAAAFRALRPGGRFILIEGVPPHHRVMDRYVEIFKHLEDRHTFLEGDLISLTRAAGFRDIVVNPFFMANVDLVDWIQKVAPTVEAAKTVERLHREADDEFWRIYEMREEGGRVLMTWRFCILSATKLEAAVTGQVNRATGAGTPGRRDGG